MPLRSGSIFELVKTGKRNYGGQKEQALVVMTAIQYTDTIKHSRIIAIFQVVRGIQALNYLLYELYKSHIMI